MTSITCSLNITIPSTVIVIWVHNNNIITSGTQSGDTASLLLGPPQSSDAGVYQCVFNDDFGSGWTIRKNVRLVIAGMLHIIIQQSVYIAFSYSKYIYS